MPVTAVAWANRILSYSNDYGKDIVPTLATMGRDNQRSERTAAFWMHWFAANGWAQVQHRSRRDEAGHWHGQSNITRFCIPADYQAWLQENGHIGRKGHPTPKAPQNTERARDLTKPLPHPTLHHPRSSLHEPDPAAQTEAPPHTEARSLQDVRRLLEISQDPRGSP